MQKVKTVSLQEAEVAFFPFKVLSSNQRVITGIAENAETVGCGYFPPLLAHRMKLFFKNRKTFFQGWPLDFVVIQSQHADYENLNVSEEYFQNCWNNIISVMTGQRKPTVWVIAPYNLSLNLSYAMAQNGLRVYRNTRDLMSKSFLLTKKAGTELFDIDPFDLDKTGIRSLQLN